MIALFKETVNQCSAHYFHISISIYKFMIGWYIFSSVCPSPSISILLVISINLCPSGHLYWSLSFCHLYRFPSSFPSLSIPILLTISINPHPSDHLYQALSFSHLYLYHLCPSGHLDLHLTVHIYLFLTFYLSLFICIYHCLSITISVSPNLFWSVHIHFNLPILYLFIHVDLSSHPYQPI